MKILLATAVSLIALAGTAHAADPYADPYSAASLDRLLRRPAPRAPHQLSAAESATKWKEEVAISDRLAASHRDTAPATVNAWWTVNYSATPLICERATTSPAESYSREEFSDRQAGMSVGPRIIDNGDEVTVEKPPLAGLDISEMSTARLKRARPSSPPGMSAWRRNRKNLTPIGNGRACGAAGAPGAPLGRPQGRRGSLAPGLPARPTLRSVRGRRRAARGFGGPRCEPSVLLFRGTSPHGGDRFQVGPRAWARISAVSSRRLSR